MFFFCEKNEYDDGDDDFDDALVFECGKKSVCVQCLLLTERLGKKKYAQE